MNAPPFLICDLIIPTVMHDVKAIRTTHFAPLWGTLTAFVPLFPHASAFAQKNRATAIVPHRQT